MANLHRLLLAVALTLVASLALASSALAAPGERGAPIGECPPNFRLFTLDFVLDHVPDPNGLQSFDVNGDGYTCVRFLTATGAHNPHGLRVAIIDNASAAP